ITDDEKLLTSALWTLSASGQDNTSYTPATAEPPTLSCSASLTYDQSSIPTPSTLSTDNSFVTCVKLSDLAGNTVYGKSDSIVRDVIAPVFTSLAAANEAADGYINDADKGSVLALYTLIASGQVSSSYTVPLDDSTPISCDSGKTYGNALPTISSVAIDGTYATCVVLTDTAGNKTYGKSAQVIRDVAHPNFTSLALANAASDGFINDSEKALTSDLWALTATAYSAVAYTTVGNDSGGILSCTSSGTYNQSSIPTPASLSSDGVYSVCVRLSDAAGNTTYGKAVAVTRDIGVPVFTSLNRANEASNGNVNFIERNATNPLFTLSATGQTGEDYTVATIETSPAIICDSSQSYASTAIPTAASVTTDGTYVVCVRLKDAASNYVYGKSQSFIRDATVPTITVTSQSTTDLTPALAGTVNDPAATISISLNSRTYTGVNNGDGTWSIADNTLVMTGFGSHNVIATATDIYANVGTDATTGELNITAPAFTTAWKTDYPGVTNNQSIKLPLVAGGTYNFVVQWGDGSDDIITSWNAAAATHSYAATGTYTVTINGTFTGWQFNNAGDKSKITNISKWAVFRLTDIGEYFNGADHLTITATDIPNLLGISSYKRMFQYCAALTTVPNMGNWDVSGVVDFEGFLRGATQFNEDLGAWTPLSAINMGAMFENASSFNRNLNSWNVSSV
ncbi:MAG: BspA family leucine-rich repeat surface protein, partial [Proteobacteria bacterium]